MGKRRDGVRRRTAGGDVGACRVSGVFPGPRYGMERYTECYAEWSASIRSFAQAAAPSIPAASPRTAVTMVQAL